MIASTEKGHAKTSNIYWETAYLGDLIADAQTGFASGLRDESGVIQIRMNNVDRDGRLTLEQYIRVPATPEVIERFRLTPGDVLFNNTNSTELVGKSALFSGHKEPIVFSNHFTRLRPKKELHSEFLSAWLFKQWQDKVFERLCNRWIGQSAIKTEKLFSLKIPLPPITEQVRISRLLKHRLGAAIFARKRMIEILSQVQVLPATFLKSIFSDPRILKAPKVKLGSILDLRQEIIHPYNNPKGQAQFVGLEHIESHTGHQIGSRTLVLEELTGRKPRFYKGDIVYGYLRPYLNKVWVAEFDGLCSVDQYVYSVDLSKADRTFVSSFMRSPIYLKRAPIQTSPGQLPRIRKQEVAQVEINLPSLDFQREIAVQLEKRSIGFDSLKSSFGEQFNYIHALPAAILRNAFNGGF